MRIIPIVVTGTLAFLTLTSAAQQDVPSPAAAGKPVVGEVVYLEGSVQIDGKEAEIGQQLRSIVTVVTGPASSCELTFAGKNAVRVAQNARATIDFSKAVVDIDLAAGGVTSVLRKLQTVAGNDAFRIRTQTAVAGVRGTSFCVWTDDTSTYVCSCNGTVHTEDAAGGNAFSTTAAHHSARFYRRTGAGISVEDAGILFHTDESVSDLAARIGEKIDWNVPD
jgi:hypothetical protein